jgi:hypothetical protein
MCCVGTLTRECGGNSTPTVCRQWVTGFHKRRTERKTAARKCVRQTLPPAARFHVATGCGAWATRKRLGGFSEVRAATCIQFRFLVPLTDALKACLLRSAGVWKSVQSKSVWKTASKCALKFCSYDTQHLASWCRSLAYCAEV